MNDNNSIRLLVPVAVGFVAVICTIVIHALPLSATVSMIRRKKRLGRLAFDYREDIGVVLRVILYALAAHLIEIAVWAALYMLCDEFSSFATAYYHSAVNYTSLGYGDILMSYRWRLLAPLETANGMLLFGLSTAMIFAVIQRLVEARYAEFKD